MTGVSYVYRHDHGGNPCSHEGQEVVVRPSCENGVEFLVPPRCIERQGVELCLVERRAW